MLTIRLARVGTKNKPFYRIILCERGRDNYGHRLDSLGTYDTFTKKLEADVKKIKEWMAKGAKLTPTLNNLFIDKKIIEGKKDKTRRANTDRLVKKREDAKKAETEAKTAAEEAKKAAEEAKKAEAEAAKAAAETPSAPAEEVPAEEAAA